MNSLPPGNFHSHRCSHHPIKRPKNLWFWIMGIGSLMWLGWRSGTDPRRLAYPCQQTALTTGLGFLGYLATLLGLTFFYRHLKNKPSWLNFSLFTVLLLGVVFLGGSVTSAPAQMASPALPDWTGSNPKSNVFAIGNVPIPICSLAGGDLPSSGVCSQENVAFRDSGVASLVQLMESRGQYFYKTGAHPAGIVGANDVVVLKINNQWAAQGDGHLSTNTDVVKGVIWAILSHSDGFTGEIVIAENTQSVSRSWSLTPANAQDTNQSYQSVINAFRSKGHPVSLYDLSQLNSTLITGNSLSDVGYPNGEYARGNNSDAYILIDDPSDSSAQNELSYPKFQTQGGHYVSMRYGIWDGLAYDKDRLTFINIPVVKRHNSARGTIAWKNLVGYETLGDAKTRFGIYSHNYFWGYDRQAPGKDFGLLGREIALITTPKLNIVDAIWVGFDNHTSGHTMRQNVLLASIDPFAVDWYASEYVLRPLVPSSLIPQDSSAARHGIFRSATRINQNAAQEVWNNGNYPYIDLLDNYDGDLPSTAEKNQMNVYVVAYNTPVAPTLIAPSGMITSARPFFQWYTSGNTSHFIFILKKGAVIVANKTYLASALGCSNAGKCSLASPIVLSGGDYSWFVRPFNSNGYGPWSSVKAFTAAIKPGVVTLISPQGSVRYPRPSFIWKREPSATQYQLLLKKGSNVIIRGVYPISQVNCTVRTGQCYIPSTVVLSKGTYTWWMQARNAYGIGVWSPGKVFTLY